MTTETTTTAAPEAETAVINEAVVKPEPKAKTEAKKATARKPAARKAATSETSAAKATVKKAKDEGKSAFDTFFSSEKLKESREKLKDSVEKVSGVLKDVGYAQLGVCGKIYDELLSIYEARRAETNKQWSALIKRGEKVQKSMEKSQKSLEKRIKGFDLKEEIKGNIAKVKDGYKDAFDKVKSFGKKAA